MKAAPDHAVGRQYLRHEHGRRPDRGGEKVAPPLIAICCYDICGYDICAILAAIATKGA